MVHPLSPVLKVLVNIHARPSCAAPLVPQEQQCIGDWCNAGRIALEVVSECLKFQIFLGGMVPDLQRGAAIHSFYKLPPTTKMKLLPTPMRIVNIHYYLHA